MRRTAHVCDRCGAEIEDVERSMAIFLGGKEIEFCPGCSYVLRRYFSTDNTTGPGYPPPGMQEMCTHAIPCGGSCGGPLVPLR